MDAYYAQVEMKQHNIDPEVSLPYVKIKETSSRSVMELNYRIELRR